MAHVHAWRGRRFVVADLHPLTCFSNQRECQSIPLDILVVMVPSVLNESARIINTFFHAKYQNFASRSEPNIALS